MMGRDWSWLQRAALVVLLIVAVYLGGANLRANKEARAAAEKAQADAALIADLRSELERLSEQVEALVEEVRRLGGDPDTIIVMPEEEETAGSSSSRPRSSPRTTATTARRRPGTTTPPQPRTTTTTTVARQGEPVPSTTTTTACTVDNPLDGCVVD